jgi:hypothetical protein
MKGGGISLGTPTDPLCWRLPFSAGRLLWGCQLCTAGSLLPKGTADFQSQGILQIQLDKQHLSR